MTALPSAADATTLLCAPGTPTPISLYESLILPAESTALSSPTKTDIIHIRVLGYLLLYPPTQEARGTLTREIALCNSDDDWYQSLLKLGQRYLRYLICPFKKSRGRTPVSSHHPSRPSFNHVLDECIKDLQPAPRNHSDAKASALVRDNFRCMVTGKVDFKAYTKGLALPVSGEYLTTTKCCHIFPDSLGKITVDATTGKEYEVASVWAIVTRFGCEDIRAELGSALEEANLHRLSNILTLDSFIHELFDELSIWFEAVNDKPNFYNIAFAPGIDRQLMSVPNSVQFISHRPDLPLPDPRYLKLHAACCRIAHMSGAAEYLDSIYRDVDELQVLSSNGASADVLSFALHRRLSP